MRGSRKITPEKPVLPILKTKKANPKPLIQSQTVLQGALKVLWCFCCAVATLIRLGRNAV